MTPAPRVTVIMPVRNGAATLRTCLAALQQTPAHLFEIIVVDDGSSDGSADVAREAGAKVVPSAGASGPAAARNTGAAHARGDILLFLDADVQARSTTITHVLDRFDADPGLDAVFGSYDDEPHAESFISQYRNLLHHFIHQTAERDSASFWAGCGAIRRRVFLDVGGFDERYRRPAIEDIELGMRLSRADYVVQLDPELQVKHLKRWTMYSMIKTDIVDRAFPWSKLLLSDGALPADLNLRPHHRWSAVLVGLLAATLVFLAMGHRRFYGLPAQPVAVGIIVLLLAQILPLNRVFYVFLIRRRGWVFAARAVPVHLLYYFYSGVTYVVCWISHHVHRRWLRT